MTAKRGDTIIGMLCVLGAITSWGAFFPFAKILIEKLALDAFLIVRFGIGTVVLVSLSLVLRRSFRIERKHLGWVALAAGVGIILHQAVQLAGIKETSATNTGWILTLIPPVTGILAWVFLRERISVRQLLGLTVAMGGVLLFISDGALRELSFTANRGDFRVLASVLTWSVYTILVKARLSRYQSLPLTAIIMGIGFVFFLVTDAGNAWHELDVLTPRDWAILVAIGIIPSGFAYYWWNAGLARLSAMNTSMFLFVEAIVASYVGYLVLGEIFTVRMVLFALIVVAGVYVTQADTRALRRKQAIHPPPGPS